MLAPLAALAIGAGLAFVYLRGLAVEAGADAAAPSAPAATAPLASAPASVALGFVAPAPAAPSPVASVYATAPAPSGEIYFPSAKRPATGLGGYGGWNPEGFPLGTHLAGNILGGWAAWPNSGVPAPIVEARSLQVDSLGATEPGVRWTLPPTIGQPDGATWDAFQRSRFAAGAPVL